MSGDWIKMRTTLSDDPAVIGIAMKLDVDEDLVVGKLHRLWSWADQHTIDGHAEHVSFAWLDRFIGQTGFAEAMQSVGWLESAEHGLTFPDFNRHNGQTAKRRAEDNKRKGIRKDSAKVPKESGTIAEESRNDCGTEKRREEKSKKTPSSSRRPSPATETDMEIARWMFDRIRVLQQNRKEPNFDQWANDVRLLREQDSRAPPDIRELFTWANSDPFWQANILSPRKLREKWDDLQLRRRRPASNGRKSPAEQTADAARELLSEQAEQSDNAGSIF